MPTKRILSTRLLGASAAVLCALTVPSAHADFFGLGTNQFAIDFVNIGNAGNAADSTGYGAVGYGYRMGVTEIAQDWVTKAGTPQDFVPWGANQPAAGITWYQAAAFVNYLNTSTAGTAAYKFDSGGNFQLWQSGDTGFDPMNPYRNSLAKYFLPSRNEWYKAAYYDPAANGGTGGYNLYPTGSSTAPMAVSGGTGAGTAVYNGQLGPADVDKAGGLSPYGTMGQGGNVSEWQESAVTAPNDNPSENRAFRGGSWNVSENFLRSSFRLDSVPAGSNATVGFRVASVSDAPVPEPTTAVFGIAVSMACILKRRRARSL